jgi:hypothetical protein
MPNRKRNMLITFKHSSVPSLTKGNARPFLGFRFRKPIHNPCYKTETIEKKNQRNNSPYVWRERASELKKHRTCIFLVIVTERKVDKTPTKLLLQPFHSHQRNIKQRKCVHFKTNPHRSNRNIVVTVVLSES